MAATEARFIDLAELGVVLDAERSFGRNDVKDHFMTLFLIKMAEKLIGPGDHFEVGAVAVPRHVYIPAVVRILHEAEDVFAFGIAEDAFDEMVDGAEVVDKV